MYFRNIKNKLTYFHFKSPLILDRNFANQLYQQIAFLFTRHKYALLMIKPKRFSIFFVTNFVSSFFYSLKHLGMLQGYLKKVNFCNYLNRFSQLCVISLFPTSVTSFYFTFQIIMLSLPPFFYFPNLDLCLKCYILAVFRYTQKAMKFIVLPYMQKLMIKYINIKYIKTIWSSIPRIASGYCYRKSIILYKVSCDSMVYLFNSSIAIFIVFLNKSFNQVLHHFQYLMPQRNLKINYHMVETVHSNFCLMCLKKHLIPLDYYTLRIFSFIKAKPLMTLCILNFVNRTTIIIVNKETTTFHYTKCIYLSRFMKDFSFILRYFSFNNIIFNPDRNFFIIFGLSLSLISIFMETIPKIIYNHITYFIRSLASLNNFLRPLSMFTIGERHRVWFITTPC